MQKVEGSSPFIRFENPRKSGVFVLWNWRRVSRMSPIFLVELVREGRTLNPRPPA
jgi:hypothetical protein